VDVDWKPTGDTSLEDHLDDLAGLDSPFDVVAVQMKDHRSIGAPAQLDDIPLFDSDKAHVFGRAAVFDPNIEDLFRSARADRQPEQQTRQRTSAHQGDSGLAALRIIHRTGCD
jgi:hypothetical protein